MADNSGASVSSEFHAKENIVKIVKIKGKKWYHWIGVFSVRKWFFACGWKKICQRFP